MKQFCILILALIFPLVANATPTRELKIEKGNVFLYIDGQDAKQLTTDGENLTEDTIVEYCESHRESETIRKTPLIIYHLARSVGRYTYLTKRFGTCFSADRFEEYFISRTTGEMVKFSQLEIPLTFGYLDEGTPPSWKIVGDYLFINGGYMTSERSRACGNEAGCMIFLPDSFIQKYKVRIIRKATTEKPGYFRAKISLKSLFVK